MKALVLAVLITLVLPVTSFAASRGDVLAVVSSEHQLQLCDGKTYGGARAVELLHDHLGEPVKPS